MVALSAQYSRERRVRNFEQIVDLNCVGGEVYGRAWEPVGQIHQTIWPHLQKR